MNPFPFNATFNATFNAMFNVTKSVPSSSSPPRTRDPCHLLKTVVQDNHIVTIATDSSAPVAPRHWDSLPQQSRHHADSAPHEHNDGAIVHDAHHSPSLSTFLCSSDYSTPVFNPFLSGLEESELGSTLQNDNNNTNGSLGTSQSPTAPLAHFPTPSDNPALMVNSDGFQDVNAHSFERAEYAQHLWPTSSYDTFPSESNTLGVAMETHTGDANGMDEQGALRTDILFKNLLTIGDNIVDTGREDAVAVLDAYRLTPLVEHAILVVDNNTVVGSPCNFTDITTTHAQEDLQRRSAGWEYQANDNANTHGLERADIAQRPWPTSSYDTLLFELNVPNVPMETHGRDNGRQVKQDTGRVDAATIVEGYGILLLIERTPSMHALTITPDTHAQENYALESVRGTQQEQEDMIVAGAEHATIAQHAPPALHLDTALNDVLTSIPLSFIDDSVYTIDSTCIDRTNGPPSLIDMRPTAFIFLSHLDLVNIPATPPLSRSPSPEYTPSSPVYVPSSPVLSLPPSPPSSVCACTREVNGHAL
ncbi:hypothetical protein BKA93DRAFT_821244 [Sparassis latifolia]